MPNSHQFRQLRAELRRLRSHFLPKQWDPTGSYSERKLDRARAYRILAHAEIESFIENILIDIVDREFQKWRNSKIPNYVMICLMTASAFEWQDNEMESLDLGAINPPTIKKDDDSINEVMERSLNQYRTMVEKNNGIKRANLKRLLMPVGITLSELDQTWLNDMNSFGSKRGVVAHKSRLTVTVPVDPKTEKVTVDNLLQGLKDLDDRVNNI